MRVLAAASDLHAPSKSGLWCIRRYDVFVPQTASINRTFTRINPVFSLRQGIIVYLARSLQPRRADVFLVGDLAEVEIRM